MTRKQEFFSGIQVPQNPVAIFNGETLDGWNSGKYLDSFRLVDGKIIVEGESSYFFYTGKMGDEKFKNFDLRVEVLTHPGSSSGIYFHTQVQSKTLIQNGFKIQINNSPIGMGDCQKTGSLYGLRNIYKALMKDNEWFEIRVRVQDKQVEIWLNNKLIVNYFEPEISENIGMPMLSSGFLALECITGKAKVCFRNFIRPLSKLGYSSSKL